MSCLLLLFMQRAKVAQGGMQRTRASFNENKKVTGMKAGEPPQLLDR
jgi:hypothetical protein